MDEIIKDNQLQFENVSLSYETAADKAVAAGLNFTLEKGKILALVGESGCGKTSILKSILGMSDFGIRVTQGRILYEGNAVSEMSLSQRKQLLGTRIGMIFQNPGTSFNPIRTYRKQFAEMLKSHNRFLGETSYRQIREYFETLKLPRPETILDQCPFEMSGGMNQRIAIAAAMVLSPGLLLADEPTSALDVTTQKTVIEEMMKLQKISGISMIIVTHNLGIAARMADQTGVMYAGRLVEYGDTDQVLNNPAHPYTRGLLASIPVLGGKIPGGLQGQLQMTDITRPGCSFASRCPCRKDSCDTCAYEMKEAADNHWSCCLD